MIHIMNLFLLLNLNNYIMYIYYYLYLPQTRSSGSGNDAVDAGVSIFKIQIYTYRGVRYKMVNLKQYKNNLINKFDFDMDNMN